MIKNIVQLKKQQNTLTHNNELPKTNQHIQTLHH